MAEGAEGKPDLEDLEETTPSGDLKDDGEASDTGKSSKLDKLLQRLQGNGSAEHSRESSPDPANKDAGQAGRQSRRKPKVTRKVVDDEDDAAMDAASSAAETADVDMVDAAMDLAIQEFLNSADKDPAGEEEQDKSVEEPTEKPPPEEKEVEKESIDVDEDGNLILPEGTVVVQPEAVSDNKPVFKGPEFRTSTGALAKKTTMQGEVDLSLVHCSACSHQINTNHANSVKRHPVLKVVLCKRCYNWYTSDEIIQDQDGMDEQCRWCGEGGDLLCCDYCHNAFCKGCIRRNLGRGELSNLLKADENSKWHCYVCDPKPLAELIYTCDLILEAIDKQEARRREKEKKQEEKKRKVQQPPPKPPAGKPVPQQKQTVQGKPFIKGQQKQGTVSSFLAQKGGKQQPHPMGLGKAPQGAQVVKQVNQPSPQFPGRNVFVEWNFRVNESNVMPIIDRAMMVTESMHMLLSSLREDIQKVGNVNSQQRIATKLDSANKLKRALSAFNKSFFDLSLFSQKTSGTSTVKKMIEDQQKIKQQQQLRPQQQIRTQVVQARNQKAVHPVQLVQHGQQIVMLPSGGTVLQSAKQTKSVQQPSKAPQKAKAASGKVEYIELLDSDDDSKSKSSPKKDEALRKEEPSEEKKKGFQLKVALGGPGHKLKGPLSKRKKVEEQEKARKAREEEKELRAKEERESHTEQEAKKSDDDAEDEEKASEQKVDEDEQKDEEDDDAADGEVDENKSNETDHQEAQQDEVENTSKQEVDDVNEDENEEDKAGKEAEENVMDDADESKSEQQEEMEETKDDEDEAMELDTTADDEAPVTEDKDDEMAPDHENDESNAELDEFKTIEEQLKQLNGGYTTDSFSKSDSKDMDFDMSKDKTNSDTEDNVRVIQLDGACDNRDSSSENSSPVREASTSGSSRRDSSKGQSYDQLFSSLKFEPLFDLDTLSNSESNGSADSDDENGHEENVVYDLGAPVTEDYDENIYDNSICGTVEDEENSEDANAANEDNSEDADVADENAEDADEDADVADEDADGDNFEIAEAPYAGTFEGNTVDDNNDDESDPEEDVMEDETEAKNEIDAASASHSVQNDQAENNDSGSISSRSAADSQSKSLTRSRKDIEAQRLLHRELLDIDDSDDEQNESNQDDADDLESDETSEEEEKPKKKNTKKSKKDSDDDYTPKGDVQQLKADRKLGGVKLKGRSGKGKQKGKKDLRCIIRRAKQKSSESENEDDDDDDDKDTEEENEDSDNGRSKKHSKEKSNKKDKGKSKKSKESSDESDSHTKKSSKGKSKKSKESSDESDSPTKRSSKVEKHSKQDQNKRRKSPRHVENSEEDSSPEDKKNKSKSKPNKSSHKHNHNESSDLELPKKSASDSFDSDLEKDIEKLAKMPKLKDKRTKKKAEEDLKKKSKEKETSKTGTVAHTKKKTALELVEELSSGEEEEEVPEDEESDKVNESDDDLELVNEQTAAQAKEDEDARARKELLAIDSSDASEDSDMDTDEKKTKKESSSKKTSQSDEDDTDKSDYVVGTKRRQRTALLDAKISDSEDDFVVSKPRKRKRRTDSDLSDIENLDIKELSSDSESDSKKKKKRKGKKKKDSSDDNSDSDSDKKKKKKKRRRVKLQSDSSNETGSDEDDDDASGTPGKKRKKIRKILNDKKLSGQTLSAAKAEEERRERAKDRQKQYNEVVVEDDNAPTKCPMTTKLVLEADEDTKKTILEVNPKLICKLKPHQVEAVKFLWDCCAETLKRLQKEEGGGCILAHCMGLGKTLSVITFLSTIMANPKKTKIKTALVVCPLNTVLNWQSEFSKWLDDEDAFDVWEMSSIKDNYGRGDALQDWQECGGIMIIGYEMYRNLTTHRNIRQKKLKKIMTDTLVDPGPDVIICDEGHILKNDASALSKAITKIKTRRRVVLTGTPLQNNLVEYHCMVDFVKPNLLGSRKEFTNRFVNPITNGQCSDSTSHDVKIMKRRAHILHETLAGCVQRKDYSALTRFLMPKYEYVVQIRLAPKQMELYDKYLERNLDGLMVNGRITNKGASLFKDYQFLMKIWTHPWTLKLGEIRQEQKRLLNEESDSSFIDDDESESEAHETSSSDPEVDDKSEEEVTTTTARGTRSSRRGQNNEASTSRGTGNGRDPEVVKGWKTRSRGGEDMQENNKSEEETEEVVSREWWGDGLTEEDRYKTELGGKLMVLAEILKMSESIGDKVLVFSQSLLSLDLIEDFLEHWDQCSRKDPENQIAGSGSWIAGLDYFRMDGSTSAAKRQITTNSFNDPDNARIRLFLISTKAGSLGINLVSANRVIVFDASWNPTHDVQSIFRVYRFGQEKPVYVYRFLAQGTMEEKIYERQVTKQSLSQRVVDEHQIERHFSSADLQELYTFKPDRLDDPNREEKPTPQLPKDRLLAELLTSHKDWIVSYHEHDSLLENIEDETLTEEERKAAWEEYEAEKKGLYKRTPSNMMNMYNQYQASLAQSSGSDLQAIVPEAEQIARAIYAANPGISQDVLQQKVHLYLQQRMEQQRMLMMQRQQHEQRMQAEMYKLQQLRIQRYRQQQFLSQMQGSGNEQQYSALMQQLAGVGGGASNGAEGGASTPREADPPEEGEVTGPAGLLDLLRKGIS